MLIRTSPGYELDPSLLGTEGLLSLTLPAAGWQVLHMGSMPGLPPCPATSYGGEVSSSPAWAIEMEASGWNCSSRQRDSFALSLLNTPSLHPFQVLDSLQLVLEEA